MSPPSVPRLLAIFIITLAAFVSGGALALVTQSPIELPVRADTDPSLARVGRLYYDGVNTLLASGSPRDLNSQIGSNFASFVLSDSDALPRSQSDLIADLQGIRSTRPQLRVAVEALSTSGDLVFASIQLTGAGAGRFAGMPEPLPEVTAFEEVLRIANGRVVARWGSDWFPMRSLEVADQRIDVAENDKVVPVLRRWTVAPNGFGDSAGATWRFFLIESGSLGWTFPKGNTPPAIRVLSDGMWKPAAQATRLDAGALAIVPAGTMIHFWNSQRASAQLLVLDLTSSGVSEKTIGWNEGVARQLIGKGLILHPADGRLTVELGQFWLPSDTSWVRDEIASGGEMVLVTRGTLSATSAHGPFWMVDRNSGVAPNHAPTISSGQALAIDGNANRIYSAVGGTELSGWIIAFSMNAP